MTWFSFTWREKAQRPPVHVAVYLDLRECEIVTSMYPGVYEIGDVYRDPSELLGRKFAGFDPFANRRDPVPLAVALQLLGAISAELGNPDEAYPFDPGDW